MSGTATPTSYEFDEETQTQIVSCLCRDTDFVNKTQGLVESAYFQNDVERLLVDLSLSFYEKYGEAPGKTAWAELIREASKAGRIRSDQRIDVVTKYKELHVVDVTNREWLLDKIEEFAQQQVLTAAIINAVPLLHKGGDPDRFIKIKKSLDKAFEIGLKTSDESYNYFDKIEERTKERLEVAAGGRPKTGVTTGVKELDECLKLHLGWGRKELSALIGGAKSSKSFHLSFFAAKAVQDGKNVLLITLENSVDVTATRIDAFMSGVGISDQFALPNAMAAGVRAEAAKASMGILEIRRRPAGSFTPNDLKRLVDEYKTKGLRFDQIVIDYTDLMAPNHITNDTIANSKSVLVDVRQIADDENLAILTAFQSNREGHKSAVVRAENVAEDFNKIRIADLVLAINRTEDERAEGKARITFAAARNSADGYTLFVTQNLEHGMAIASVESVE
jgi:replicative DNA helicase